MEIESYEDMGVVVYTLKGRVDSNGAERLRDVLQTGTDAGQVKMVLVMSGVTHINSAGMRVLADIITQNQQQGGNLRLVGLSTRVRRVFEIIGFLHFFPVYDNVVTALDWTD
jgi:anti-sigma B factor antagonist